MARQLDVSTLDAYAGYLAGLWQQDAPPRGRAFVAAQLQALTFKDEFAHVVRAKDSGLFDLLGGRALAALETAVKKLPPREDKILAAELKARLAVDPDGKHIPGTIGKVQVGARFVRLRQVEVESPQSIRFRKWAKRNGRPAGTRQTIMRVAAEYWPVYAGETEEREADTGVADRLPEGADPWPVSILHALNTTISNAAAIAACDGIVDLLDEGSSNGVFQVRTGTQPADPDTSATGTLLATLALSDPAFGDAADDDPGATATADTVSDDTSIDATATAGYHRASSSNDGAAPLNAHIDGEAGTSGADSNWSTTAFVSGATASLTAWTFTMPETSA